MPITLPQPMTFGDTSGDLGARLVAGSETISLPLGTFLTLIGDSNALLDHAIGGGDTLTADVGIIVIGDAITITDQGRGGNDTI